MYVFEKKIVVEDNNETKEKSLIMGKAIIENETKNGSHYTANVKTLDSDYTVLELPYIYYPGYVGKGDGATIKTFETDNGFLGIILSRKDTINIEVKYGSTAEITMARFISIVFMISFVGFAIYEITSKPKFTQNS